MKRLLNLLIPLTLIYSTNATALDSSQLHKLQNAVIEMCRGGTVEGKSSTINVTASAQGKIIVIKNLIEGGGDAKAAITNKQWDGIKALANPEGYSKCVESTLNLLVPALSATSNRNNQTISVQGKTTGNSSPVIGIVEGDANIGNDSP